LSHLVFITITINVIVSIIQNESFIYVFSCCRYDSMKSLCDRFNKAIDSMVQMVNRKLKKYRFFSLRFVFKGLYFKWAPFVVGWQKCRVFVFIENAMPTWPYPFNNKRCWCSTIPNYNTFIACFYSVTKFEGKIKLHIGLISKKKIIKYLKKRNRCNICYS